MKKTEETAFSPLSDLNFFWFYLIKISERDHVFLVLLGPRESAATSPFHVERYVLSSSGAALKWRPALFHLHSLQACELQRGWRNKRGTIPSFPQKIPCSRSLPGLGPGWHRSVSHPALPLQKNVHCTRAVTLVDPGMMLFITPPREKGPLHVGLPCPLDPAYVPFLERQ